MGEEGGDVVTEDLEAGAELFGGVMGGVVFRGAEWGVGTEETVTVDDGVELSLKIMEGEGEGAKTGAVWTKKVVVETR